MNQTRLAVFHLQCNNYLFMVNPTKLLLFHMFVICSLTWDIFLFQFVGDKVAYALSKGLKVIACVGETLEQRESRSTMEVVAAQTKAIAGTISALL